MAYGPAYFAGQCKPTLNEHHGIYDDGRKLPQTYRERALDLYHEGHSQRQIALDMRTSVGYVNKVIKNYNEFNSSLPLPRKTPGRTKITDDVFEYIESEKNCKPSIYTSEIQNRLLLDGVSPPGYLPSRSAITKCIREDCSMTKKKISIVPVEASTHENIDLTNYYLDQISQYDYTTIHFFDESNVIVTTGNRKYGNSYKGEPAIEFQRYASNANYTINLLNSAVGVDYSEIVNGPSNGMEMLNFFDRALEVNRRDGSTILENGDVVVMDNCGFHHGHFVEPLLRNILQDYGVSLLFQPPYSPHFNTCELCFNQIKCYLKQNTSLTQNETEIAIGEGISKISKANSLGYFRKCGYI